MLYDEAGRELYSEDISADQMKGKHFKIKTGKICPTGRQKYCLKLVRQERSAGTMNFQRRRGYYPDVYDGICTVNGDEKDYDLFLQAYMQMNTPYSSGILAALLCTGIFALAVILLCWMHKTRWDMVK